MESGCYATIPFALVLWRQFVPSLGKQALPQHTAQMPQSTNVTALLLIDPPPCLHIVTRRLCQFIQWLELVITTLL